MKHIINFLSNNINLISAILPAIITSAIGFVGVKYTYTKNIPLDKLEFTYDEVYYPIYKFINDKNNCNNIYLIKNSLKIYFDTYEKYLDFSTIKLYKELCKCTTKQKQKVVYKKFYNNIYDMNTYLRKRLGYLESNIFQLYKYSLPKDKAIFWTVLTFVFAYSLVIFGVLFNKDLISFAIVFVMLSFILFIVWLILLIKEKLT